MLDAWNDSVRCSCYALFMAIRSRNSKSSASKAKMAARAIADVAMETLWPTRCAVCDQPGERVLCGECKSALKLIDLCRACPKCGAPYGSIQCTECNEVMLSTAGIGEVPFERMSHAAILNDAARRIVATYKDSDERRLAECVAEIMSGYVDPDLQRRGFTITYIPDTLAAFRRRGFDHSLELAQALARRCNMQCACTLMRPKSADQRKLGRRERIANMASRMSTEEGAKLPERLLLVDDVCTTGATIYSACRALRDGGATEIHALTFAQVMD